MTAESKKSDRYNAREAEPRWQKKWDDAGIFATSKCAFAQAFGGQAPTATGAEILRARDVPLSRPGASTWGTCATTPWATWSRATSARAGFAVLHPMGWDAFGMPAENAAIERKVHPRAWTYQNIEAMKAQLQSMGLSLDWAREIATCDPAYYKHQQKMFLDFLKAGLVERKQSQGQLGPGRPDRARQRAGDRRPRLALGRDGRAARDDAVGASRSPATRRTCSTRSTRSSAGRRRCALMQKNWIGRSEGLLVRFALDARRPRRTARASSRSSPRAATRCSARSSWRWRRTIRWRRRRRAKNPALAEFIAECKRHGTAQEIIDTAEKQGFDTGIRAVHPFDPAWTLPVYVANFILMDYGTGAIFGCPAHDQRDLDFVNKYGLGNVPVVCPPGQDPTDLRHHRHRL